MVTSNSRNSSAIQPAQRSRTPAGSAAAARLAAALIHARFTGRPLVLSHLVTCRCCCTCATCLWRDRIRDGELTAEQIQTVYRDAARAGIVLLSIWGGEPLLRDDLPEILESAVQAGLQTTLITNGALLPERIDRLAPHLDAVICSLDWPGPRHDEFRGYPGLYNNVVESIRIIRHRYPSLRVMINAVLSRLNTDAAPALVRLAASLDVGIYIHPIETGMMGPRGFQPAKESLALPPDRLAAIFRQLLRMKHHGWPINNSATYLGFFAQQRKRYRCHARKVYVELWPNGDLLDCLDRSRPLANVRHTSLAQLLARPSTRRARATPTDCCVCNNANVVDCSNVWSLRPESVLALLRLYLTH